MSGHLIFQRCHSYTVRLIAPLCQILCHPMDCNSPGSSAHEHSPGKNTGVGCHALLQEIFPTQGSNPGLPHCGHILYHLSQPGSPFIHCQSKQVIKPFCDSVSPSRMLKDLLKEGFQFSLLSLASCSAEYVSVGFCLMLLTSLYLEGGGRIEMNSCSLAFLSPVEWFRNSEDSLKAVSQLPFNQDPNHSSDMLAKLIHYFIYKMGPITPTSQGSGDS